MCPTRHRPRERYSGRDGRRGARKWSAVTPEDRLGEALKQARLASEAEVVPAGALAEIEEAIVDLRRARTRLQLADDGESTD